MKCKKRDGLKAKVRKNKITQILRFYVGSMKDNILIESRYEQKELKM